MLVEEGIYRLAKVIDCLETDNMMPCRLVIKNNRGFIYLPFKATPIEVPIRDFIYPDGKGCFVKKGKLEYDIIKEVRFKIDHGKPKEIVINP